MYVEAFTLFTLLFCLKVESLNVLCRRKCNMGEQFKRPSAKTLATGDLCEVFSFIATCHSIMPPWRYAYLLATLEEVNHKLHLLY